MIALREHVHSYMIAQALEHSFLTSVPGTWMDLSQSSSPCLCTNDEVVAGGPYIKRGSFPPVEPGC